MRSEITVSGMRKLVDALNADQGRTMDRQMDITEIMTFPGDDNQSTTSTESDDLSFQLSVHSDTESLDDGQHGVDGEVGVQESGEGALVSVSSMC